MGTSYTVDPLAGIPTATAINDNLNNIQDALDRALSRYGDGTNTVQSDLDINGYHVYNLPEPAQATEPVRLQDLNDKIALIQSLVDQAQDAANSATNSASSAASSAASAQQSVQDVQDAASDALVDITNAKNNALAAISDATTVDIITTTTNYTVTAGDVGDLVVCNNTADISITLPVGVTDGMNITILRNSTGRVNLLTAGNFIIANPFTSELRTTDSVVDCVCIDGVAGSWMVSGDLLDTLP